MIPPAVKEKLLRLQRENKKLKEANPNANENAQILQVKGLRKISNKSDSKTIVFQTMIDDLKERESALQASNRKANQKIMELESRLEESKGHTSVPRVPGSREELELKVAEANKKIANLQESIQVSSQATTQCLTGYTYLTLNLLILPEKRRGDAGHGRTLQEVHREGQVRDQDPRPQIWQSRGLRPPKSVE